MNTKSRLCYNRFMLHPLKEGPNNDQWSTLPEICMELHMQHTGSGETLTPEQYDSAVIYVASRVHNWKPLSNGMKSAAFDAHVFGMCIAVLVEADEHSRRNAVPSCS